MINHLLDKRSLAAVVSGFILVGFICSLLLMNYNAQIRLHDSAIIQRTNDIDKQARSLGYFFSERRIDIKDLSQARELAIFFENKALGMSMEYGLKASLVQMEHRFGRLIRDRRINEQAVYTCIMFIDEHGDTLVRKGREQDTPIDKNHLLSHLEPDHVNPMVMACRETGKLNVVVCMAYSFKGRFAGQIIAQINTGEVFGTLISEETPSQTRYYADWGDGWMAPISPGSPELPRDVASSLASESSVRFSLPGKDKTGADMIALKEAIPETDFSIVATAPVASIWGHTRPIDLLIAMGGLALLTVGMLIFLWNMNAARLVLKTRLDEEKIRKSQIEEKNVQLEAYQNNLEDLVRQRTQELEEAQKELVHKAMEAGRAQLAAMTLHNIGNAITPVSVYAEMIGGPEQRQTLTYLSDCYRDLFSRKEDLGYYVTEDPRGIKVADYMKSLIHSLEEQRAEHESIKRKIMNGISYIAQILTLQQAYAPEQVEMKENVDLNLLVTDALNMQENTLNSRGIRLDLRLSQDLPGLRIEKNKLMQVVVNLIKNSCDAMKGDASFQKHIGITTYHDGSKTGMTISDTGSGVEPENLDRIFSYGTSSKGSTGFGLYYCKSFVEQNNGKLTLQSLGPGQGATVTMEFEQTQIGSQAS